MDQVQEVLKQSHLFRELTGDELDGLGRGYPKRVR